MGPDPLILTAQAPSYPQLPSPSLYTPILRTPPHLHSLNQVGRLGPLLLGEGEAARIGSPEVFLGGVLAAGAGRPSPVHRRVDLPLTEPPARCPHPLWPLEAPASASAGTAPPPLPRWWPTAPRLPVVKLESLKRWNEERGLWCEKGVQVLLTTVGAFAAFGLMTIAISTDYWLYTRALICNTTNLTAGDDGPPHRGGSGSSEKKDPGGLTHSGLWRICCLE
ncbi:hypothetical protein U0070_025596, partial [Myodes glareolus]